MKKTIFTIATIAITTISAQAQLVRIYKGESLVATYTQSQVDKVVFSEEITGEHNGHEYVDLGLKDEQGRTIYWATCNIGAETPEECGDYFAWGETEPYYQEGHSQDSYCSSWREGKTGYNWASYKWGTSSSSLTKYCANSNKGAVDNKTVLDPEDDAATQIWGGNWRIPTRAEREMLRNNCTWTWNSGMNGFTVTGANGNSIFLPAAGFWNDRNHYYIGTNGRYWTSSLDRPEEYSEYACILSFDSNGLEWGVEGFIRMFGMSIRAVYVSAE